MHFSLVSLLCLFVTPTFAGSHQIPFNALHHSGAASPYFDAPSQFGIDPATPSQCTIDQAAYILRHGAYVSFLKSIDPIALSEFGVYHRRYPEPGSYTGWQNLFQKIQNTTFNASGPLTFLPHWVPPVDDIANEPLFLSATGAAEAFNLGVKLRKQYGLTPGGGNITVW